MPIRNSTLLIGLVLVVVGILGFLPGVDQNGLLFGIFRMSTAQDVAHLVLGAAVLLAVSSEASAQTYAKIVGTVYGIAAVLGFVLSGEDVLGIYQTNLATNVLYAAVALALLGVGFATAPAPRSGYGGDMRDTL